MSGVKRTIPSSSMASKFFVQRPDERIEFASAAPQSSIGDTEPNPASAAARSTFHQRNVSSDGRAPAAPTACAEKRSDAFWRRRSSARNEPQRHATRVPFKQRLNTSARGDGGRRITSIQTEVSTTSHRRRPVALPQLVGSKSNSILPIRRFKSSTRLRGRPQRNANTTCRSWTSSPAPNAPPRPDPPVKSRSYAYK